MLPLYVVIAICMSVVAYISGYLVSECSTDHGSLRYDKVTPKCTNPGEYHCLPSDVGCKQLAICRSPVSPITLNYAGLDQYSVISMPVTLNSTNTELYQDIAAMVCNLLSNETREKGIKMLVTIAEKLGIDIARNVQKGPCNGTDYTLATRNQSGCFIVNKCLKHVDEIKTGLIMAEADGANGLEHKNVTLPYDPRLSLLFCEIERSNIQFYNTTSNLAIVGHETGNNHVVVIVSVVLGLLVVGIILTFLYCRYRHKWKCIAGNQYQDETMNGDALIPLNFTTLKNKVKKRFNFQ